MVPLRVPSLHQNCVQIVLQRKHFFFFSCTWLPLKLMLKDLVAVSSLHQYLEAVSWLCPEIMDVLFNS